MYNYRQLIWKQVTKISHDFWVQQEIILATSTVQVQVQLPSTTSLDSDDDDDDDDDGDAGVAYRYREWRGMMWVAWLM